MSKYRTALPQLSGSLFLTEAGIETDLIFNRGIDIPEFATHTLLPDPKGREAIANYQRGFLALADQYGTGFILDSQTWKAHPHWAADLGASNGDLREANRQSIEFIEGLRAEYLGNKEPIVLNGIIGPRGDAYAPEEELTADDAERYHATQIGWLADTAVDMIVRSILRRKPLDELEPPPEEVRRRAEYARLPSDYVREHHYGKR